MHWLIITAFLAALGLNIYSLKVRSRLLEYITKPLLTILLLVFYILAVHQIELLVVLALLGGLAGDVFLMLPDRNAFFVSGLFSFLAGHLFYILAFIKESNYLQGLGLWICLLAIPYIVMGIVIFVMIKPYAGKLYPYVAGYILTIVCMGVSSLTTLKTARDMSFLIPVAGAILFIVSDSCLALAKFRKTKSRNGIIMLTYGLAQMLITIWFAVCV